MAKKSFKKMYNVNQNEKKDENIMHLNIREMQLHLSGGLNRTDGIVKTGTGAWENKKRKAQDKRDKKYIKKYC